MTQHRSRYAVGALAAAGLLTLTACGAASGAGAQSASSGGGKTVVSTGHTKLGTVLVGKGGKTLYLDANDSGGKSSCTGSCAAIWPPVGKASAGSRVKAAMLGTITRSDGSVQATYHGQPLYYYSGDSKAGDVAGQGIDQFFAIGANGSAVHQGKSASNGGGYSKNNGGY